MAKSNSFACVNLLNIKDDKITNVISIKDFNDGYLFMGTRKGQVKKIRLDMFAKPRNSGVRIIYLIEGCIFNLHGMKQPIHRISELFVLFHF